MKLSLIIVLAGFALFAADPAEELQTAARRGQTAEVKRLLEAGAPLESKNQYGATPLYLAVFNGHNETALLLLEKGANPNVTDTFYKSSILDSALQKGTPDLIKALLSKGAVPTARQLNMLIASGNMEALNAVLTHRFEPADLTAALRTAIASKKEDMAAALRKAGAPEPAVVAIPPGTLESYVGDYVSDKLPIGLKIMVENGQLKGQGDGQGAFPLTTESPTEFTFAAAGIKLVFENKDKFVLHQGGQQFPYIKKGSAGAPVVRTVPAAILSKYIGKYSSPDLPLEIDVTADGGQLSIQATNQPRLTMRSESDTEFTFSPAGVRITFPAEGKLTLHQGGKEFAYTRKEGAK